MTTNLSQTKRQTALSTLEQIKQFLQEHGEEKTAQSLLQTLPYVEKEIRHKRYGLVFEEHQEAIQKELEEALPILEEDQEMEITKDGCLHFLIESDNLAALHLLLRTHREKVDVIYLDPPYNTGAKDWKYDNDYVDRNDTFRHSKWLSMMDHRLRLARQLLTSDGILICAIDENEQAALGMLLEQIFGREYEIDCITIVHNPRGVQGQNFSYTHEYAYFVHPSGKQVIGMEHLEEAEISWSPLRNWGGESLRSDARNCFYPIIVEHGQIVGFGEVITDDTFHPASQTVQVGKQYWVYPIDSKGVERKWRYARQTIESIWDILKVKEGKDGFDIQIGKPFRKYKTVWDKTRYDANLYGTRLVNQLVGKGAFDYPKSLWNVYDCIKAALGEKKDAVILDFFAGSGTTAHAVMEMNQEDGGSRRFILVTNNEGDICRSVTWKRIANAIEKNGYQASLKYYRLRLLPVNGRFYDEYAQELCVHCKELIQLECGMDLRLDGQAAFLENEEEAESFFETAENVQMCRKLYLNRDILLGEEQEHQLEEQQICRILVPDYYYEEGGENTWY